MFQPGNLLHDLADPSAIPSYEDNPFFRARLDRYNLLDDVIRTIESAANPPRKYLEMLKRRREELLADMVEIIANRSAPPPEPPRPRQTTRPNPWRWP